LRVGDWDWAGTTLDEWLGIEVTADAFTELFVDRAILRALRGQAVDAAADIEEAARLRSRMTDPQYESYELLARAWSALAAGDLVGARTHAERAAAITDYFQPLALPLAARAALWSGDRPEAVEAFATFEATTYRGSAVELDRAVARAGVAALDGRGGEALAGYREALRGYRALGLAFDEAIAVVDMATVLPAPERDAADVGGAIDAAREILTRLGARPFLERLDAATAAVGRAPTRAAGRTTTAQPVIPAAG
jgi:hypothetical protein